METYTTREPRHFVDERAEDNREKTGGNVSYCLTKKKEERISKRRASIVTED